VLISGGGLVGLTLALALDQAGLSVVVVDTAAPTTQLAPRHDGRSVALAFAVWRMLGALGVAQRIGAAEPITQILVSDGAVRRATSPLGLHFGEEDLGGEPMGWMVENRHVRLALDSALRARPSITRLAPDTLAGFETGSSSVQATTGSGRRIAARLLVGADGAASAVRTRLNIRSYGWSYGQAALSTTIHLEEGHGGVAHELFLPGGPLALLPLTDSRASIVWSDRAARSRALVSLAPEELGRELTGHLGDGFGAITVLGPTDVWPLKLALAADWTGQRVALAGDAAHVIHPLAGQGLNLGLKDVAALAEVLAAAVAVGEDIGSPLVLERYASWRRADTMTLALACDAFTRLFSNDAGPVRLLRGLGLGLVDRIAPARAFFARHAGGAVGDIPQLLRGKPLSMGAPGR
jgi:2-octaprenyl-6-methoxyphenol hydroxylase